MKFRGIKAVLQKEGKKHSRRGRCSLPCNRNHRMLRRRRPADRLSLQRRAERAAYRYLAVSGSCRQRGGFGPAASRLGGCGAGGTSGEARRLSKRLAAQALKGEIRNSPLPEAVSEKAARPRRFSRRQSRRTRPIVNYSRRSLRRYPEARRRHTARAAPWTPGWRIPN